MESDGASRDERIERLKCLRSPCYFLDTYGRVYDAAKRGWVAFRLWPAQREVLEAMHSSPLVAVLKARQLGLTWLGVGYALWLMICRPGATALLFSRRDDEAVHLLDFRLRGMYERLPRWLAGSEVTTSSAHEWRLSNGSAALAFPTTGGRSYTASLALVDEADFVPDLDGLLNAVKPTVDGGGKLVLLSTADKSRPESAFKRVYRGAQAGDSGWKALFLGWRCRPERDEGWYARQRAEALARTGSLDDLWQEYPATEMEALAVRSMEARFPVAWLQQIAECGMRLEGCGPAIPGLSVYQAPEEGQEYVIGADPAEGNPQSDESAATVVDKNGWEMACLAGRFEPAVFAGYVGQLSGYYNRAAIMVERNNHGHAVLLWLQEHGGKTLLRGRDEKAGWLTTPQTKALMFDQAAERFRAGEARVRSEATLRQLEGIEGTTLAAPAGRRDDRAMSLLLALAGIKTGIGAGKSAIIPPVDWFAAAERGPWDWRWRGEW